MSRRASQAGYTFFEAMVVIAMFTLLVLSFGRVFGSTSGLSTESRANLHAQEDNRRSLEVLANKLRGACWASLTGFAADGTATAPGYKCATGADGSGIILDVAEAMSWRSTSAAVNGVPSPGEVICTKNGVTTVLAPRVPSGGFKVIQSGSALRVQLTTYFSSSQRKVATATSEVSVSLRN